MDEWAFLILLVLAFPVMALIAFILALGHRGRIRLLEARVATLEAQVAEGERAGRAVAGIVPPPAAVPAPPAPEAPAASLPAAAPPAPETFAPPVPVPPETAAAEPAAPEPPLQDVTRPPGFGRPRAVVSGPSPASAGALKDRLAGFEEKIGARWAVWVGGLALALGGIFLVRFAVEQDLIGPAARVTLGLMLAVALLAGGEWLRRKNRRDGIAPPAGADGLHLVPDVPSVLTAAGTMTAFGSLYAAYELYHLISPQVAFLALAATGIATLLAALLHGPALAALGFVGAAVTPFLISTGDPNAWGVALLIAAVAASALGVARVKRWAWLAYLAIAGVVAWGVTLIAFEVPQAVNASGGLGLFLLVATAALLAPGLLFGPQAGRRHDPVSSTGAAGALLVTATAAIEGQLGGHGSASSLTLYVLCALGVLGLAWRVRPMTYATLAVALLTPLLLTQWVFPPEPGTTVAPAGPMAGVLPEPARLSAGHFMTFGFGMGAVLLGLSLAAARRREAKVLALVWAVAGTIGPALMLIAAYGRLAGFDRSLPFAAIALALAFVFTLAAEMLARAARRHGATVFAAGGVVSLALALTFALEKGWLTVSLSLAALGVAWVSTQRPLPGLRQFSAALGLVVLGRIIWLPSIAIDPGPTPVFNWLLWGYGVPALAFLGAARLLARGGDDRARRVHECLALVFSMLLVALEVRHLAHHGDIYAPGTQLFETGLLSVLYGAYAVGLARIANATGRWLTRIFSDLVAVAAAFAAVASLTGNNPFSTGEGVGGPVFNALLLAYGLPAGLALLFGLVQPAGREQVRLAARALAVVLGLAYVTFEVSRLFQGPELDYDAVTAAEWYAYSAAWLGFAILLLLLGLWRGSRTLRLASGAVMVATVLKVFLSDMSDLEGVLRAVSFIGLGLVLVAMGWLYQRLLARAAPPASASASGAEHDDGGSGKA
ncbi:DUF2339 domain-containing protein [Xanthobacter autotrophicus DSM 431]|uniref:DUF2339 domain-containing protein n=1 Tax=Xanthobacter nonsaccharivorans TaxID=3119912 RepID=UPI0037287B75